MQSYGTATNSGQEELPIRSFVYDPEEDIEKKGLTTLSKAVFYITALFAISLGAVFLVVTQNEKHYQSLQSLLYTGSFATEFRFTLKRQGYKKLPYFGDSAESITNYNFLGNYDALIEPNVPTELVIYDTDDSVQNYKYDICTASTSADSTSCVTGNHNAESTDLSYTASVSCSQFNEFSITVTALDADNNVLYTSQGSAVCMYVRREIRDLTEDDLSAVMDAMHTMWTVSEDEGVNTFGENYHDSLYFSKAHDFGAAQRDADHIHQGIGFVTQHVKLTNIFEAAMQAVNPAVTLPYWDFTIEASQNQTVFDSFVFTADTFGSIARPVESDWGFLYRSDSIESTQIQDGRWANLKSDTESNRLELANAFGYMRGPWNMNPSPYISRFASGGDPVLPSCSKFYTGLADVKMLSFLKYAPFGPHAAAHGAVGGVWGCDKLDDFTSSGLLIDSTTQKALCAQWGFFMKQLYRAYYITPRTDCAASSSDLSESEVDCGYVCSDDQASDLEDVLSTYLASYGPAEGVDADWSSWREFICNGDGYKIFVGDHLESASTSDPSFWPVHPTLERLVQVKFMTGVAQKFTWPTELADVCDQFMCYVDGVKGTHDSCCFGHYESDQMYDFVNGDTSSYLGPSNREVFDSIDPTSDGYSVSYIYDNFDWDHCEEDFDGTIERIYNKYGKSKR